MGVPAPEPTLQSPRGGPRAVRLLCVTLLLMLALAGCTAPEEAADPLLGACPQWVPLHGPATLPVEVDGAQSLRLVPDGMEDDQGHPVDRYIVRFYNVSVDGGMEVRAFADAADRRLAFTDYQEAPRSLLYVDLLEGMDLEVDVFLTAVAHGTDPAPDVLRLDFQGDGSAVLQVTMTPMVRICGVPDL